MLPHHLHFRLFGSGCLAIGLFLAAGSVPADALLPQAEYRLTQAEPGSQSADSTAIRAVIQSQLVAFRARDGEAAFALAAPNIRRLFGNANRFMAMVARDYGMIYDPVSVNFEPLRQEGDRVLQPVLFAGRDFQPVRAIYEMALIEGQWRIAAVYLEAIEDQMT